MVASILSGSQGIGVMDAVEASALAWIPPQPACIVPGPLTNSDLRERLRPHHHRTTMILRNRENESDFFLPENWYRNRKKGISAMLRVRNEEEFIAPCLRSIASFFDELVLVLNCSTDNTREIAEGLGIPHLRILDYPFELFPNGPGHEEYPEDSVREISYFYNWCLSQTTRQVVCKWDGDMVALPDLNRRMRRRILRANTLTFSGTNLTGKSFGHISREQPVAGAEPRFFRVNRFSYYVQGPACELFHHEYTQGNDRVEQPLYLHFKWAKAEESATAIWPKTWREDPHFVAIYERRAAGEVYQGLFPEALLEELVSRSLDAARTVEDLKSQERVMRTEARVLSTLRQQGVAGDLLEIGCKLGKNTVFLGRMAQTLFPDRRTISVDPFSQDGAALSLHDDSQTINDVHAEFSRNTADLDAHCHHRKDSRHLLDTDVPNGLVYSFIDGEHTYEGVMSDWRFVFEHTSEGGVIAVDDFKNGSWPEVIKAYREIIRTYPVTVLSEETKSAFLLVGKNANGWGSRHSTLSRLASRLRGTFRPHSLT